MAGTTGRAGRLVLGRLLGAGGFATVWLAHDPDLDAPVAVKILADNWATDADARRRFADEARLLRRVDSPHLVRVHDVGELADGRPYLVMTYADGGSLQERMTGEPWPTQEVLRVISAAATGLEDLHANGIIHRDVGPRNILFRRRGPQPGEGQSRGEQVGEQIGGQPAGEEGVLLGDLGIAKDLHWASGMTRPAGTDGYQAPEQRGYSADIGPATDVYGLAVTAGRLLGVAGPPWPTSAIGDVLTRATREDPGRRTPSPAAFVAELAEALDGGRRGGRGPSAEGTGSRRRGLLLAAGTVLALTAAGAVTLLGGEPGGSGGLAASPPAQTSTGSRGAVAPSGSPTGAGPVTTAPPTPRAAPVSASVSVTPTSVSAAATGTSPARQQLVLTVGEITDLPPDQREAAESWRRYWTLWADAVSENRVDLPALRQVATGEAVDRVNRQVAEQRAAGVRQVGRAGLRVPAVTGSGEELTILTCVDADARSVREDGTLVERTTISTSQLTHLRRGDSTWQVIEVQDAVEDVCR